MNKQFRIALAVAIVGSASAVVAACNSASSPLSPVATQSPTTATTQPASSTSTATPSGSIAPCNGSQLRAAFVQGGGYTGHWGVSYTITNVSATACSLSGFPTVMGVRSDGSKQPLFTSSNAPGYDKVVDLVPGESSGVEISFVACGGFPEDQTPVTSANTFASAALVPPGGGSVVLPPAPGTYPNAQLDRVPPDWGTGYTCPGSVGAYSAAFTPTRSPATPTR